MILNRQPDQIYIYNWKNDTISSFVFSVVQHKRTHTQRDMAMNGVRTLTQSDIAIGSESL